MQGRKNVGRQEGYTRESPITHGGGAFHGFRFIGRLDQDVVSQDEEEGGKEI